MGTKVIVVPGDRVRVRLPYSELCCHMRVAGRVMAVEITDGAYPAAQLIGDDGSPFSAPITLGEAGIYGSMRDGLYAYTPCAVCDGSGTLEPGGYDCDECGGRAGVLVGVAS